LQVLVKLIQIILIGGNGVFGISFFFLQKFQKALDAVFHGLLLMPT
jgi:hypothetical protein